nr:glycosyltransferase family 4 protein [Actinomyces sp. ZJ308]
MRIAMVTNTYPPRMGGLELHIANLAQSLSDLGHRIWVLTLASERSERMDSGIQVRTERSHLPIADVISFPSFGTTSDITRFLRDNSIDVVSTHTRFFPMSLVGLRAAHAARIPTIHTEHGSGFVATPSPIIAVGSRAVDVSMGRYVLSHADRVLAVSPQAAAFAQRLGASHAEVFYNAIAPSQYTGSVEDRPTHLVFVGRMVAGKGWDAFQDAVFALRSAGMDVTGEMIGDGAQLGAARERCEALGLSEVVKVRGRVPQEEVRVALRGSTLVNPTTLSEGFQTTLLEAIAEQGRVVTFDVPGAQLLREQGAPITVCASKTSDSLVAGLTDALSDPLPHASTDLIQEWTWPVRARQYESIAFEVINQYARH